MSLMGHRSFGFCDSVLSFVFLFWVLWFCFEFCDSVLFLPATVQQWCAVSFLWAPKLARKCESKHWLPCGADGRSGARCTVTWLPNFLGWIDLLSYGAPPTRGTSRCAWSSAIRSIKTSLQHGVFNSTSLRHWRLGLFNNIRTGRPSLYRDGVAWPSLIFR